jgi:hypothetical protein
MFSRRLVQQSLTRKRQNRGPRAKRLRLEFSEDLLPLSADFPEFADPHQNLAMSFGSPSYLAGQGTWSSRFRFPCWPPAGLSYSRQPVSRVEAVGRSMELSFRCLSAVCRRRTGAARRHMRPPCWDSDSGGVQYSLENVKCLCAWLHFSPGHFSGKRHVPKLQSIRPKSGAC